MLRQISLILILSMLTPTILAYFNPNIQTTNQGLFNLESNQHIIVEGNNNFEFRIKNQGKSDTYTIKFYLLNQIENTIYNITENKDSTKYTYQIQYNANTKYYNYYYSEFQPFLVNNDPGEFLYLNEQFIQFIPKRLITNNIITLDGFQINFYEIEKQESNSNYLGAYSYEEKVETFNFNSNECANCTFYVEIFNSKNTLTDIFYVNSNGEELVRVNQIEEIPQDVQEEVEKEEEKLEEKVEEENQDDFIIKKSSITNYCIENWECDSWSECLEDKKSRNCSDKNNCGTKSDKPRTSMYCSSLESNSNSFSKVFQDDQVNQNISKKVFQDDLIENDENQIVSSNLNFNYLFYGIALLLVILIYIGLKPNKTSKNEELIKNLEKHNKRWKKELKGDRK